MKIRSNSEWAIQLSLALELLGGLLLAALLLREELVPELEEVPDLKDSLVDRNDLRGTLGCGKLHRARSRLYRNQILQVNTSMRLKALAEICTMHSLHASAMLQIYMETYAIEIRIASI